MVWYNFSTIYFINITVSCHAHFSSTNTGTFLKEIQLHIKIKSVLFFLKSLETNRQQSRQMHRTHYLSNSSSSRPHSDSQISVIYVRAMLVRFVSSFEILGVIPLLHNCESMYLPLICLLIKMLFCIYYLFLHKFSRNLFSRLTAPKIENFAELIFAISPLVVNFAEFIFAVQFVFFVGKFAGFNFAILGSNHENNCPQKFAPLRY